MKIKTVRDRKRETTTLTVRTTKNEKLEYAQAEFLCQRAEECFLPFSYTTEKDELLFSYDITDLVQMNTYLKAKLSLSQFHALLGDVVRAVEVCEAHELHYANMLFELEQVFLDPETNDLRFAYVPAKGVNGGRPDINAFLREVSSRVSFICAEDRAHAHDLIDFLQRQTVFSLIDFKSFLDGTQLERRKDLDDNALVDGTIAAKSAPANSAKGFDFLKKQAGSVSATEHRQKQNLVEQVFSDVSEVPSGPTTMPQAVSAPLAPDTPEPHSGPMTEPQIPSKPAVAPQAPPVLRSFTLVRISTGEKNELLPGQSYSLGRSSRCDITIKGNSGISREHAHIRVDTSGCFLTDQGSTNGCSANGVAVASGTPVEIKRGARIKLADEEFSVE